MAGPSLSKSVGSVLLQSYRRSLPTAIQQSRRSIATTSVLRDDRIYGRTGNERRMSQGQEKRPDFAAIVAETPDHGMLSDSTLRPSKGTHSLHVYSHRHNTHITFTHTPNEVAKQSAALDPHNPLSQVQINRQSKTLLTLSTGNIGFKKGGRGSYDAAYQLAAYAFKYIQEKGMLADVEEITVLLRGYGSGRDAVSKAILGSEGRFLRNFIKTVVDTTRLKQGGTRGKKPRRLG